MHYGNKAGGQYKIYSRLILELSIKGSIVISGLFKKLQCLSRYPFELINLKAFRLLGLVWGFIGEILWENLFLLKQCYFFLFGVFDMAISWNECQGTRIPIIEPIK